MMASEKLKLTDGFREGIEEHIKTVCPKADLKGAELVDDLMNRIPEKLYLKPCEELTEHRDKLPGVSKKSKKRQG